MNAIDRNRETEPPCDDIQRIAVLSAALRVICVANQLKLRDQSLMVTRHPRPPVSIDFSEREPFGFVFTEGHEAAFHVPSGHRFVIEHLHVSCGSQPNEWDLQLVTKSRHMFRQVTLTCAPELGLPGENVQKGTPTPIIANESTLNTFLFSNGAAHSSSVVPPESYLQIWGYLEPTYDPESY